MYPRVSRALLVSLIGLCHLAACATDPRVTHYRIAQASQVSAERAYQTLYLASQDGRISTELRQQADDAYRAWMVAQRLYVDAARHGVEDLTGERQALQRALHQLVSLTAAVESGPTKEPR